MKKIEFTQELISALKTNRADALANEERYFNDGLPCKKGHESVKLVTGNRCFFCKRIETKNNAEKRRKRNGIIPKNKVGPLQEGETFGKLVATGIFKVEHSINRKKKIEILIIMKLYVLVERNFG